MVATGHMPLCVVEPCNEALRLDRPNLFWSEVDDSYDKRAHRFTRVIIVDSAMLKNVLQADAVDQYRVVIGPNDFNL